jgi:hypothetical protein
MTKDGVDSPIVPGRTSRTPERAFEMLVVFRSTKEE